VCVAIHSRLISRRGAEWLPRPSHGYTVAVARRLVAHRPVAHRPVAHRPVAHRLVAHRLVAHRVGERPAATHAAMHTPLAALQARMAAGTPVPPVDTPATPPAAATQDTHTALQPVWQMP